LKPVGGSSLKHPQGKKNADGLGEMRKATCGVAFLFLERMALSGVGVFINLKRKLSEI
jgi:hypothetical protein